MTELIDRYVHQVGLYVRPRERAEVETELRSQIQDQLEDSYGGAATREQIAAVLKHFGDPRTMAASYGGEQYLVGPELYPFMMTVLRFGLPLVPTIVVIVNLVGAVLSQDGSDWISLLLGSLFTALQAALIFFAAVVGIFAILQRSGEVVPQTKKPEFNPLELPPVNEPGSVDRLESAFGIAIGALVITAILYFLQVGGLTLRFNLNDPGEVVSVPTAWLVVLLITVSSSVFLNLWALIRRRWTLLTWLIQTAGDALGAIALYFAVYTPLAERFAQATTSDDLRRLLDQLPVSLTLFSLVIIVLVNGIKLIRLWQQRGSTV